MHRTGSLGRPTAVIAAAVAAALALAVTFAWLAPSADAAQKRGTRTVSNAGLIQIPADRISGGTGGQSSRYPSTVQLTGFKRLTDIDVTIRFVNHTDPDDLDIVLVGPGNRSAILWSDAGGANDLPGSTFRFVDDGEAQTFLPDSGQITGGTYGTSNYEVGVDFWPGINPSDNRLLSAFYGPQPNGNWRLFVFDDVEQPDTGDRNGTGAIANGWSLKVSGICARANANNACR